MTPKLQLYLYKATFPDFGFLWRCSLSVMKHHIKVSSPNSRTPSTFNGKKFLKFLVFSGFSVILWKIHQNQWSITPLLEGISYWIFVGVWYHAWTSHWWNFRIFGISLTELYSNIRGPHFEENFGFFNSIPWVKMKSF